MRLTGEVRLDNNGGFVQAALDINGDKRFDVSDYTGVLLDVMAMQSNTTCT